MKAAASALSIVVVTSFLLGCHNTEQEQLRDQVKRLSAENASLKSRVEELQHQLSTQDDRVAELEKQQEEKTVALESAQTKPIVEPMTLERARAELQSLVQKSVQKVKESQDTQAGENRYGMRTEYFTKSAIYGLVRNHSKDQPYMAKVIVPYERFLETASGSQSYGKGSARFLFAYHKGQWSLVSHD